MCFYEVVANVPRLCEGWDLEALSFKLAQSLVLKITNSDKSQTPQFRETAVVRSLFYLFSIILFRSFINGFSIIKFSKYAPIMIVPIQIINIVLLSNFVFSNNFCVM